MRTHSISVGLALALAVSACSESRGKLRAPPDAVPPSITVTGGPVTEGTTRSVPRRGRDVAPFSIPKTPVTVAQYRRCVDAGACDRPALTSGTCSTLPSIDGPTFDLENGGDVPLTCASAEQAAAYCDWVGGRLPRPEEWTLAARGPNVMPYPWGVDPPTCERTSRLRFFDSDCCGGGCDGTTLAVGKHATGASTYGALDVLSTKAEIVGAADDAFVAVCAPPARACLVVGWSPSAIEQWTPLGETASMQSVSAALPAASFRCAWDGGAR